LRSADATTLFRVFLAILAIYLVIIKFNPFVIIILLAVAIILDAIDGFFALYEVSKGKIGFLTYLKHSLGDKKAKEHVAKYKAEISKIAPAGARIDVAGDRIIEFGFWMLFLYLHIVPLWIVIAVVIRHAFADALMGAKGTSMKAKTSIARRLYTSNLSRWGINVVKFVTFSYLVLVYVAGYPALIGTVLVYVLFAFIMLRGAAEIYEALI
jgi:phosphatidylglycerophosphate synthase